mmetsp:Transcript_9823/g.27414  ORF Transcript_9823/g.27414 Transcript_9823/m.27414 type:complete len:91 (+) Transcript_9823:1668-1940(+)
MLAVFHDEVTRLWGIEMFALLHPQKTAAHVCGRQQTQDEARMLRMEGRCSRPVKDAAMEPQICSSLLTVSLTHEVGLVALVPLCESEGSR